MKLSKTDKKNLRFEKKKAKIEEEKVKEARQGTLKERCANLFFAYKFIWKANKRLFIFRIPLLLLQSLQTVVPILFIRAILNELTIGRDIRCVIVYASLMAMTSFLIKLISNAFGIWDSREWEKLRFNVSEELARSVMDMSYATLENPEMQDYVWLAKNNHFDKVIHCTSAIVGSFITVISMSAIVFTLNPVILGIIIVSAVIRFIINKHTQELSYKYNVDRKRADRMNSYFTGLMESPLTGKEIRMNNLEDWVYSKTEDGWQSKLFPLDNAFRQKLLSMQNITGIVSVIQEILIYIILALKVIHSTTTVGDFSMYLSASSTFSGLIISISSNYSYLMTQASLYLKNYRYCLSIAEKQNDDRGKTHIEIPENIQIEFRNVSFKYPKTDRMILENINITIKCGETLSIVGVNGAGKTTFVKLLCRFYEPTEGEILVNGIPTRDIPLTEYYKLLSVVFQDFNIFQFTFRENIVLDTKADDAKLADTIQQCGLGERVETLPDGVNTYLYKTFDPNGIELSGGEGQKIAIARAVYRDAPIVVFDEPTSALDPIAEYNIYCNFHKLAKNRTAIYISHRLSSTRFTDRTAVFVCGTIAEYGTHDELMAINSGIYRKMFTTQAKYYER